MYLDNYISQLSEICKLHKVKHLFAFGSVLTEKFTDTSDIDFVVDIESRDPIEYANNYFDLKFKMEDLLDRSIDLLEEKAIKNKYLKLSIDNSKIAIYGT